MRKVRRNPYDMRMRTLPRSTKGVLWYDLNPLEPQPKKYDEGHIPFRVGAIVFFSDRLNKVGHLFGKNADFRFGQRVFFKKRWDFDAEKGYFRCVKAKVFWVGSRPRSSD